MSCGEPFGQERLMVCAWSCLVLVAVVVLALHDAPAPVVIGLMAFLPRPNHLDPASRRLRRQGALFPDGWSSLSNTQIEKAEETGEKGVM
jgi:hypothetical protein